MKFGQLKPPSKYLTKEDADPAKLVTIKRFSLETLEMRDKSEQKFVVYFNEFDKGMVLNTTNRKILQKSLGLTDDDDVNSAIGAKIVLFNDPNVQDLNGELVGGIRFRKYIPKPKQPLSPPPPQAEVNAKIWPAGPAAAREPGSDDDFNDDISDFT